MKKIALMLIFAIGCLSCTFADASFALNADMYSVTMAGMLPFILFAPESGEGGGGGEAEDPVIKGIKDQIEKTGQKAREKLAEIEKQLAKYGDASEKLVEDFKAYEQKNLELEKQLDEMSAKMTNQMPGQRLTIQKELEKKFTESDEYKNAVTSQKDFKLDVSDIMQKTMTVGDDFTGDVVPIDRRPGVVMDAFRRQHVRDFMSPLPTSSDTVERVAEESHTSAATTLAEGGTKLESSAKMKILKFGVEEIAHLYRMTLRMFNDATFISGYIRMRGVEALKIVEDTQLLSGDGQTPNIGGMLPAATAFSAALVAGIEKLNRYDILAAAALQGAVAEFEPNVIFINKKEGFKIRHLKDDDGNYIFGNPWQNPVININGTRVVEINAMPDDTFLAGDLNLAVDLFDRQQTTVDFSFHDRDNFQKNLVTFRIVERIALAIWQPKALVTGKFSEIIPT